MSVVVLAELGPFMNVGMFVFLENFVNMRKKPSLMEYLICFPGMPFHRWNKMPGKRKMGSEKMGSDLFILDYFFIFC